jgi:dihydroneopterin aldolase
MRATEFLLTPFKSTIVEGLMKYSGSSNDWVKDYYWKPFIEGLPENNVYSFSIDSENFDGIIQNGQKVANEFLAAIAHKDPKMLQSITFSVQRLDDDGNPVEGEIYNNVKLNQIFKDEKIKGELKPNLGNIAELVLGCAVTTKFEKQGQPVSKDDVIGMAKRLAEGKGTVQTHSGKDNITFSASVPFIDKKAFFAYLGMGKKSVADYKIPSDTIKGITQHIASAVDYVNTSKRVQLAVSKASDDPTENLVDVLSDGGNAEQQKITKVDLKISVANEQGKQSFNLLSIKAGRVGQFGQVSGYAFDALNGFFQQSVGMSLSPAVQKKFAAPSTEKMTRAEKKADVEAVRDENYFNGFTVAYDEIERSLARMAKTDQIGLVKQVYDGILHHATRNEENVEMVILTPSSKKAFSELTFGAPLKEALNDYQLVVKRGNSEKMHFIEIYGFPVTTKVKKEMGSHKELLVKYRSYMQASAVRNIIEMGSLLKELADWEKIEQKQASVPAQPAVQQPAQAAVQPPDELATIKKNAGIKTMPPKIAPKPAFKTSQPTIGTLPSSS